MIYNEFDQLTGLLGLLGFIEDEADIHYINVFASRKLIIHYLWIASHTDNKSVIANELIIALIKYIKDNGLRDRPITYSLCNGNYLPVFLDNGFVENDQCLIYVKERGV